MRELPLLMRLPEKRNVQHVRLVRVDDAHLGARNRRRDEVLLNRVRVNTIIDFRQFPFNRPPQLRLFRRLEPLESLDQIQFKFNREPRRRLPHHHNPVVSDAARARAFLRLVDSAAVYHNASTRFTDGAEFGMGAEIGISTDKLHARGPMGLEELTTYKYVVTGDGTVRK